MSKERKKSADKEPEVPLTYKVLLLGDSGVGKTCIFKKLMTGQFSELSISTIGMDKRLIKYDNLVVKDKKGKEETKNISLELWDTAGQERFRAISKNYYSNADCILFLYNVTFKESFDNIDKWMDLIHKELGPSKGENADYLIVLMGNQKDRALENPDSRQITEEEAIKKSKEYEFYWGGECSAKTDTKEQLRELLCTFTKELYSRIGVKSKNQNTVKVAKAKKQKGKSCLTCQGG